MKSILFKDLTLYAYSKRIAFGVLFVVAICSITTAQNEAATNDGHKHIELIPGKPKTVEDPNVIMNVNMDDSLSGFDLLTVLNEAGKKHIDREELPFYIRNKQKEYILNKYYSNTAKIIGPPPSVYSCNNEGFESGTIAGWTGYYGYNSGCTPNCVAGTPGATTAIVGAGTDACTGISTLAPGGSNFSCKLGNNSSYGVVNALQQSFVVSAAQTMFTYQYAIVLENPVSGHVASEMPYFSVEVRDASNNFIPCGNYDVQYANGAANFTSFSGSCGTGIYRDWTTVTVDLTAYVGQTLSFRYIVSGCGQGGHFGYAYIDANCASLSITGSTAVCPGLNANLSAPAGMGSYAWSGPGIIGASNGQNITANTAGTYTCNMTSVAGCPLPPLTHTLINAPTPVANFTNNNPSCNTNISFTDASTVSSGSITGWSWDFGDAGATSTSQSPSYNYTTPGTHTVTLIATSDAGCTNTYTTTVNVSDSPTAIFNYAPAGGAPACEGVTINFTDASTSPVSSITDWSWDFGDPGSGASNTSASQNPSHTYAAANSYPVTFTVTNSLGCTSTTSQTVVINPFPVPDFTCTSVCQGTPTSFTNNTPVSPTIASTNWDFTTNGSTDDTNTSPTYTFPSAGTFTTTLTSTTSAGCVATYSAQVVVHPNPVASFTASTECEGVATNFDGSNSTIAAPDNIAFYNWSFGDASSNSGQTTSHTYASCGTYTANLVVVTNNNCTNNTNLAITVNCRPTVTVPTNTIVCPATTIPTTTLTSNPTGASYVWSNDLTTVGLGASGVGDVPAFTTTNADSTQLDAHITITPTSPEGCLGTPSTYTISVKPTPVMYPVSSATYCPNNTVAAAAYNTTPIGSTYDWTNSDTNIGLGTSGTTPYSSFSATNTGSTTLTGTISVTPTLNACVGLPITYNIVINPTPVVTVPADAVYCPNNNVPLSGFTSVPSGATFDWTNTGDAVGITSSSPGQIAAFSTFNTGATTLIATINVTPTLASCPGLTQTYSITVNPTPHVNAISDVNECPNTTIAVNNISSTPAGATLDWTNSNTSVGLTPASGTGSVPTFTTSNTGSTNNVSTITITPTLNNCVGPDSTYTITVRPTPVLTVPADASYCPNVTTVPSPGFSTVPGGSTVAWTNSNTSIGLTASSGIDDYGSFTPLNITTSNQVATITAIPTLAGCVGLPQTYSITVFPKPIASVPVSSEACPADAINGFTFGSTPNDPLTTYSWSHSNNFVGLNQGFGTPAATPATNSFTASNASNIAISTTFTLVTSLNGCFSDPKSFDFTVNPLPTPNFSASHTCYGNITNFTSIATVGTGNISFYQWDFDNNGTIDANSSSSAASTTYNASGTQTITHTAITDKGCKKSTTKTMYVNPNPEPMLAVDQPAGCPDLSVVMSAVVNPTSVDHNNSIVSWVWDVESNNSTDFTHSYASGSQTDTVDYVYTNTSPYSSAYYQVTITVTTDSGCVGTLISSPTFITVYAHPVADFTFGPVDPQPDIDNPLVEFYDQSAGATEWFWSFNDPNSTSAANSSTMENPSHYYSSYDPATYDVTLVIDNGQCWDTITKPVEILPNWTFFIPNAFSPNGDGVNDGFRGTGVGIDAYSIYIFDRWGNMIWTSNDLDEYWDGKVQGKSNIVQQDTYVWKVKFKDLKHNRHEFKGTVTVVR